MAGQLFSLYQIPAGVTGTQIAGGNNKPVSGLGRSTQVGINVAWGVYSTTAVTLSISDVVHLFSLPEGAVVLDGWIAGIIKSAGTVVKVGVQAGGNPSATGVSTDADLLTAASLSTTRVLARFNGVTGGLPYQTAAIAAATYPKLIPVVLTLASGTVTASVSIGFYILYATAGQ